MRSAPARPSMPSLRSRPRSAGRISRVASRSPPRVSADRRRSCASSASSSRARARWSTPCSARPCVRSTTTSPRPRSPCSATASEPAVEVRRRDGRGAPSSSSRSTVEIADWVTEAGNPGNAKGVERVDISLPSPLLAERAGARRHARDGRSRRRPRRGDAGVPALRRRAGLRQRRVGRAVRARGRRSSREARTRARTSSSRSPRRPLSGSWREIEAHRRGRSRLRRSRSAAPCRRRPCSFGTELDRAIADADLDGRAGSRALLAVLDDDGGRPAKDWSRPAGCERGRGRARPARAAVCGELEALADPARGAAVAAEADGRQAADRAPARARERGGRSSSGTGSTDLSNDRDLPVPRRDAHDRRGRSRTPSRS